MRLVEHLHLHHEYGAHEVCRGQLLAIRMACELGWHRWQLKTLLLANRAPPALDPVGGHHNTK